MVKFVKVVLFVAVAASAFWSRSPVWAQSGIVVANARAEIQFGREITFLAAIQNSMPIQTISIVILDESRGIVHVGQPLQSPDGSLYFVFDAGQNTLLPFSLVRWWYEFTLGDGTLIRSETFSVRYDDTRFAWQSLESNGLRIHWSLGDAAFAQSAMNAATAGLRSINEIVPVDINQPVDVFIYPAQSDLPGGETWSVGHANATTDAALVVVEPGLDQSLRMEQRIPHELMHVALRRHIGSRYAGLPAWLREGMATLVEINPTTEYDRVLIDASRRRELFALADLCASFPPEPDSAFLAYAQSRSFVMYLRNSFGSSKLLELARHYADGVTCERGIELAYGTSLAQLEFNWRASALGESSWSTALQNMFPYLVLCGMALFLPFVIALSMRRNNSTPTKAQPHDRNR